MDKTRIQQLISEKVTGVISEEDELLLAKLVKENPAAQEELLQAEREYNSFVNNPLYTNIDSESNWEEIQSQISKRKRRQRTTAFAAVGLTVIALAIIGKILLPEKTPDTVFYTKNVRPNTLQLQFETGELIDLYAQPADLVKGGLHLKIDTNARVISFQYTGNNGNGPNILRVPPGMDYQLVLSDGSKIHLNSLSEITFPFRFNGLSREVLISGEAYMEIASNKVPFIVETPYGVVRVLGTTFNVNTYDRASTKVSLVKGKIACAIGGKEVTLQEGKAGLIRNGGIEVNKIDETDLSWLTHRYPFREASPAQLARLIYRIYGVDVIIDDEKKARKIILSGTIRRYETLQSFMENMEVMSGLNFYLKDGKYHWY